MRRWLILIHRYLGIVLSVLFAVWFISGIAMIYAKGMPRLTPQLRLERLAPIPADRIHVSVSRAIEDAGLDRPPARVILSMLADRPVYRIGARTVFADTGEVLKTVDAGQALGIAARFMGASPQQLHQALQTDVDQWTISQRRLLPLHKIVVDDAARTELYVSPQSGEIVVMTTRASRSLAWVAAIPHWLYFTSLRTRDGLWRQVILWTSGLGCGLALIGIILGVTQFKVRYSGWMRWHYLTGLIFGILTFTWVFSGWLSMDPWDWSLGGGLGNEIRGALTGGPLNARGFPQLDVEKLSATALSLPIKEVEYARIQGEPYYLVRTPEKRLLVSASNMQIRIDAFPVESLMELVKKTYPDTPVLEAALLTQYDSYYYSQDGDSPLPVLRIKFADKDRTWLYLDPAASQMVRSIHRLGRINRWIYHGFHSLDFSFWYYSRPGWDAGMIILSLGGAATSIIGVYLGIRRLLKSTRRMVKSHAR